MENKMDTLEDLVRIIRILLGTVGCFLGRAVGRIVCLILCHRWLTPF